MPIPLQCLACGERFSVDESLAGQMVKCPKCKSEAKALGPTGDVDESLALDLDSDGPPAPDPGPTAAPSFDNMALEDMNLDLPPDDDGGVALADPGGAPAMPDLGDVSLAEPSAPAAPSAPPETTPAPIPGMAGMGATMNAPSEDEMAIQDDTPSGVPGGPPAAGFPPGTGGGGFDASKPQAVRRVKEKRPLPVAVLAGAGVVVLVALYFLAGMLGGGGGAETGALEMAARVPKDSVFVMALPTPKKTVGEYSDYAKDAVKDSAARDAYNDFRAKAKDALGFDPTVASQYPEGGIDLTKPATFSVLPLAGGNIPKGLLVTTGAVNFGKVIGTLKNVAKHLNVELEKDAKADPDVYSIQSTVAATVVDERMYLYVAPPGGDPVKSLRQHLNEGGEGQLAQDEDFKSTLAGLTQDGEVQGFINTRALGKKLKNGGALKSFEGIAFSGSGDKTQLYMRLPSKDKLLKMLEPGQECRDFLKQAPKPMLAVTFSSKDLYGVIEYIADKTGDKDAMKQFDQMTVSGGATMPELKKNMKNCAFGVSLYKGSGGMVPVTVLVYIKAANPKAELEDARKKFASAEVVKKGSNEIFVMQDPFMGGTAAGMIGDYAIFCSDSEMARDIANGDAKGWKDPKVGGKDLMAMEIFPTEVAEAAAAAAPEEGKKMLSGLGGRKSDTFVAVTGTEDGISIRAESGGDPTAMLAALGVPAVMVAAAVPEITSMLPAPGGAMPGTTPPPSTGGGDPANPADPATGGGETPAPVEPKKPVKMTAAEMKANEETAVANIRTLLEAQQKYFENDWDGDGVKEYAQTFKELKEPGGQPGELIPAALTGAFGEEEAVIAGYHFRVLTSQGTYAPGGKKDYIKKEDMVGGFALIAYPAAYEGTGKNTYIADIKGRIYLRDLGKRTESSAPRTTEYSPTRSHKPVK